MFASSIIDVLPLWTLNLIVTVMVLLSIEVGWRIGNERRRRTAVEKKAPVSAVVGSSLGLLAFLLAFTFSMAASRYDNRKQFVLQEANAIGTTYLRADFISDQMRDETRRLLREYTALRAGGVASIMTLQGMAQSAALQDKLWAIATNEADNDDSISTSLFIQSLNEMIDLDASEVAANRNRIPDSIWIMLGVLTIFSMTALGFEFGLTGTRSWVAIILLALAFTTVITLLADLDRPHAGLLQVSQQPLIDLLNKIGTPIP